MKYIISKIHKYWIYVLSIIAFHHHEEAREEKSKRKRHATPKQEEENIFSQHKTIKSLLSGLDQVFEDLDKIKPKANWVQGMIKKYGPYIIDTENTVGHVIENRRISDLKVYGLPAMIINYVPNFSRDSDKYFRSFFLASKQDRPDYFIPRPGFAYYHCIWSLMVSDRDKKRMHFKEDVYPIGFYASVNKKTGEVDVFPEVQNINHEIKHKIPIKYSRGSTNKAKGYSFISSYNESKLSFPDHRSEEQYADKEDKRENLIRRFCVEYNATMQREHGVNIYVKKGKNRATFTVPQNRWKYFFKDRIDAMATDGKKKRIFHAVIAHQRHLANGKTSNVRTHYRGSRHFVWEGYEIKIVMQGKHGVSQATFGAKAHEYDDDDNVPERTVDVASGVVADRLNKIFEGNGSPVIH